MTDRLVQDGVIEYVQGDLPLTARPYHSLAARLGITEQDIAAVLQRLKAEGKIRRFGAVLRHQQAGFIVNALVAWQVPAGQEDEIGAQLAACKQISHLYLRQVPPDFPYNMFSMVHARTSSELDATISELARITGVSDYQVLHSVRELKKTSMRYVPSAE